MVSLFVLINWQFFVTQVGFWWQRDVLHRVVTLAPIITGTPDTVQIPGLGITAPLVYVDDTDVRTFQTGLANGVVHYPDTANPGGPGNAFYFGHSSDYISKPGHYKTVFALLPQINLNDEILITNQQGRLFSYRVISKQIVSATATEWLDQGDNHRRLLTLQTSYPIGTALKRYIVQAEMN
nr:hypothetical protein [uncultured bacterium]